MKRLIAMLALLCLAAAPAERGAPAGTDAPGFTVGEAIACTSGDGALDLFARWRASLAGALRDIAGGAPGANAGEASRGSYSVRVLDQYGQPVPGAVVRFCDVDCRQYAADADGVIAFSGPPARYSLQIAVLPEGYACDPAWEGVCDGSGERTLIQVQRQ